MDQNPSKVACRCLKIEEEDQTKTERPVGGQESTQVEELDIDFRVPGFVTCSCERSWKYPSSKSLSKNRKSSSLRSTSSRLAEELRLQPIQHYFESDDPWIGQCRVTRVVRNNTESAMFPMSSLLKSRNCLLHLRTDLVESESRRNINKLRLDALSFPHYVIKKGRCHGARHGKTEE